MSKDELTTAQAAVRMGVSVHAVRFWIKRGLLPNAYEREESRGAVWVIPAKDLEGFTPPKKTGRPPKAKDNGKPARKRVTKKGGKK
jgi:hypothetical protein